jgi:hypothetical protein
VSQDVIGGEKSHVLAAWLVGMMWKGMGWKDELERENKTKVYI